jgi:hypothetical protein
MRLTRLIALLRRNLPLVRRVCYVLLGALVLLDALPAVVNKEHAHTWPERHLPGFWAVFGFVGCVVLILASKAFGRAGIMTREDYYDE